MKHKEDIWEASNVLYVDLDGDLHWCVLFIKTHWVSTKIDAVYYMYVFLKFWKLKNIFKVLLTLCEVVLFLFEKDVKCCCVLKNILYKMLRIYRILQL